MPENTRRRPVQGLRWLATEFLVVALGVLAALVADATWENRAAERRANAYLAQLSADLLETERLIASYQEDSRVWNAATSELVQAFRLNDRPSADSLYVLVGGLASWAGPVRPVLGTFEALVSSGDLAAIRDEGLRIEITKYLESTRTHLQRSQNDFEAYRTPARELFTGIDVLEGLYRMDPDSDVWVTGTLGLRLVPPQPERTPFEVVPEEFFGSREMYYAVLLPAFAQLNENGRLISMLEEARTMRESIERYLDS